jgi:hypothetical protein
MTQKPEVAKYVQELEQRQSQDEPADATPTEDLPSAAELIREVEQFLRQQRGDGEKS